MGVFRMTVMFVAVLSDTAYEGEDVLICWPPDTPPPPTKSDMLPAVPNGAEKK